MAASSWSSAVGCAPRYVVTQAKRRVQRSARGPKLTLGRRLWPVRCGERLAKITQRSKAFENPKCRTAVSRQRTQAQRPTPPTVELCVRPSPHWTKEQHGVELKGAFTAACLNEHTPQTGLHPCNTRRETFTGVLNHKCLNDNTATPAMSRACRKDGGRGCRSD
jgi:hypothetical protein